MHKYNGLKFEMYYMYPLYDIYNNNNIKQSV